MQGYWKIPLLSLLISIVPALAQAPKVVQLYRQDELIKWINANTHLTRVKADDCQLVQDIRARAEIMKIPAYQFLWGDMLAWGVCVPKDAPLGLHYMHLAADQGLPAALEQLGRYYHLGKLVQQDMDKAVTYLREAAALGNLKARLRLVSLLVEGYGSPTDYEDAYRWLYHTVIADEATHKRATQLLEQLAQRMPYRVVARAQR